MEYIYNSPLGDLLITYNNGFITGVYFDKDPIYPYTEEETANGAIHQCITELDEYFAGTRKKFETPIAFEAGTTFQKKVWDALRSIPYGELRSYGDIAATIGQPKAPRAVGGANNRNPISIIVPCHRVIGKSGSMVGYGGGIWRKEWLLEHEAKFLA